MSSMYQVPFAYCDLAACLGSYAGNGRNTVLLLLRMTCVSMERDNHLCKEVGHCPCMPGKRIRMFRVFQAYDKDLKAVAHDPFTSSPTLDGLSMARMAHEWLFSRAMFGVL